MDDNQNNNKADITTPPKRAVISLGINLSAEALNRALTNVNAVQPRKEETIPQKPQPKEENQSVKQSLLNKELEMRMKSMVSFEGEANKNETKKAQNSFDDRVLNLAKSELSTQDREEVQQKVEKLENEGIQTDVNKTTVVPPKEEKKHTSKGNTDFVDKDTFGSGAKKKHEGGGKFGKSHHMASKAKLRKTEDIVYEQDAEVRDAKIIDEIDTEEYTMLYGGNITVRSSATIRDFTAPRKKMRTSAASAVGVSMFASKRSQKLLSLFGDAVTIADLADGMSMRVERLIKMAIIAGVAGATAKTELDLDTAELIATEQGYTVKRVQSEVEVLADRLLNPPVANNDTAQKRDPVVTVMGHVDHGKTSILDAIRSANVANKESGGITQHIGAYTVEVPNGRRICFIDTPGHVAFSEMRSRGAKMTDIVVLVVAADDGVMAQTLEAISHVKSVAGVPIVVAINKIDKSGANIDGIKQELARHEIISDEYGGDVIMVPVSALKHTNLDKLLEAILLQADMMGLVARTEGFAQGVVIEAKIDKSFGSVTTFLVQAGTLKVGDIIVCGKTFGKVRIMRDCNGAQVKSASVSTPVEVIGLGEVPAAGDKFMVVKSEKDAIKLIDFIKEREQKAANASVKTDKMSTLSAIMLARNSSVRALPVVIKADAHGSVEAINIMLNKLEHPEVKLSIVNSDTGPVSESDVMLAKASGAKIFAFNVKVDERAKAVASQSKIDIKVFNIIYDLEDSVKDELSKLLEPIVKEELTGKLDVRVVFDISKVGKVAGCYTTEGLINRGSLVKIIRNGVQVGEGKLSSLQRQKEEAKEVRAGQECGIQTDKFSDFKVGDTLEVYKVSEERRRVL